MSKGANSQAGFNAQNWAALSLFIQYSRSTAFQRIDLEQPRLADFVLVFRDKRIICESKKSHITYADIREILDTLPIVNENDEILIICTSTGPRVKESLENARYFNPVEEELVKQHKYKPRHLKLLPKLKIWVVDQDMNETIVRNLMVERFQSWLPDDELDDLVTNVLVKNIYNRSAKSESYRRAEFEKELTDRKQRLREKDDYKINERSAKEIVAKLLNELRNPDSPVQSENRLKAISADQKLHFFALREITSSSDLNLVAWNNFWLATFGSYYSREVLSIFEKQISSPAEADYVVSFLAENMSRLRFKNLEEYGLKSCADVLMKALDIDGELIEKVYESLKQLYAYSIENPLSIEDSREPRDKWLMEQLALDIKKVYSLASRNLKDQIVEFIYSNFNLVDEELKYWHKTPHTFFTIVKRHLLDNPDQFDSFLDQIERQYIDYYKRYKAKYTGWELMGGGVSNFEGNYSVHDKAFVTIIIQPYLHSLSKDAIVLVSEKYIASRVSQVSSKKPDFMNRALIPHLITEYIQGNNEAFKTLSDFIKMRKGIPHKAEIIFQQARDSQTISIGHKWKLLEVALREFGFPINIFMDQVLWELLEKNYAQALETFSSLLNNNDYMGRQTIFDSTVIQALAKVIQNPITLNQGIKLLKRYLRSKYFRTLGSFDSYDAKTPILLVLNIDKQKGIELIQSLIKSHPNDNKQRVFGAVLRDIPDDYLLDIYQNIIKPELDEAKTVTTLAEKFSNIETREAFIWFAEKLSKMHQFDEAFHVAEFFLDDPSPTTDNEYDKSIREGKHDFTINTVRGCIAWAIVPVNSIAGRAYTERAFEFTKKLCTDKSLYVRQMSLMLLESLANNRHATMPNTQEWFMDYQLASSIEAFAFEMLRDKTNYQNAVMQHLARVFTRIRTLDEKQAIEVITTFLEHGDVESLKNLDSFILFMAEFRKNAFKDWRPDERGNIPDYDEKPVQDLLMKLLVDSKSEQRESLVWHIAKLPEETDKDKEQFDRFFGISVKYLKVAIKQYDHNLFHTVYRFIDDYIDDKFEDCYMLWRRCIEVERPAIFAEAEKDLHPSEYNWWPYHYNGNILLKVLANRGTSSFLADLEYLTEYPERVSFPLDIDNALSELEKLQSNQDDIKRVYEKLIARSYMFNSSYEKWLAGTGNT